jgi:hypothetical protein
VKTRETFSLAVSLFVLLAAACGGAAKEPLTPDAPPASADEPASPAPNDATAEAASAPKAHPAPQDVFERLKPDFVTCYEQGKKAAPKMATGKVTMHAAVDVAGRTSCVVPSDDTGLTQEVEDCIGARLAKETYDTGLAWSYEIPIVVKKDGALTLGDPAADDGASFENVETHGLSDATPVVKSLLPALDACMRGMPASAGLRLVYVGGRVGKDGKVECALATGAKDVPDAVRACAADVLMSAKFAAPKSGSGLVSIPVKVLGKKRD